MGRNRHFRDWPWWSIIALACLGMYRPSDSLTNKLPVNKKNLLSPPVSFATQCTHLICFFCSHELIRIHWRCYPWSVQE